MHIILSEHPLVTRLVQESERVIQARTRGERDVRGFLKSGLVDEQIRVGAILQELFQAAQAVDWQSQKIRRTRGPLPPVGVSTPNLHLIERFLVKDADVEESEDFDLSLSEADPSQMDAEFWNAYRALDREQLFESTVAHLRTCGKPLTLGELSQALPPSHDLETLVYWLAMACAAGLAIADSAETIDLFDDSDGWTRFLAPRVQLSHDNVKTLESGGLE